MVQGMYARSVDKPLEIWYKVRKEQKTCQRDHDGIMDQLSRQR